MPVYTFLSTYKYKYAIKIINKYENIIGKKTKDNDKIAPKDI